MELDCDEIAVFTAASEAFTKKNTNCSIQESLERIPPIIELAKKNNIRVRGYVSCIMGCPYSGEVDPKLVRNLTIQLLEMGCFEVSLGDTIGSGTPQKTRNLLNHFSDIDISKIAAHFHDTGNLALENLLIALEYGISVMDSSVGGLGGCPYAQKVVGNVCTENVVYMLEKGLGKPCFKLILRDSNWD